MASRVWYPDFRETIVQYGKVWLLFSWLPDYFLLDFRLWSEKAEGCLFAALWLFSLNRVQPSAKVLLCSFTKISLLWVLLKLLVRRKKRKKNVSLVTRWKKVFQDLVCFLLQLDWNVATFFCHLISFTQFQSNQSNKRCKLFTTVLLTTV